MRNMGHCRFRNTLPDLEDCEENLFEPLGQEEARARKNLIELCHRIIKQVSVEDIENLPKEEA